jgi:hypothetical protein
MFLMVLSSVTDPIGRLLFYLELFEIGPSGPIEGPIISLLKVLNGPYLLLFPGIFFWNFVAVLVQIFAI